MKMGLEPTWIIFGDFKWVGMMDLILECLKGDISVLQVGWTCKGEKPAKRLAQWMFLKKEERGRVRELEIQQVNIDFWKSVETSNPATFLNT